MSDITFEISYKYEDSYESFEKLIKKANKLWSKIYNSVYDENECHYNTIIVGKTNNKIVSCLLVDVIHSDKSCIISSLCTYPHNNGIGTYTMYYTIDYLKKQGIETVNINIDKTRYEILSKFFTKFHFNLVDNKNGIFEDEFDFSPGYEKRMILRLS